MAPKKVVAKSVEVTTPEVVPEVVPVVPPTTEVGVACPDEQ